MTTTASERFERLYRDSSDPWGYLTSTYEQEKYHATLAALPPGRHGLCLEVGCSIGVFTGLLAARCEHVVAMDFSLAALELARRHLEPRRECRSVARLVSRGDAARDLGRGGVLGDPLLPAPACVRDGARMDQGPARSWCQRAGGQLARHRARRATAGRCGSRPARTGPRRMARARRAHGRLPARPLRRAMTMSHQGGPSRCGGSKPLPCDPRPRRPSAGAPARASGPSSWCRPTTRRRASRPVCGP